MGPGAMLKHTTTLFSLSDHGILSREWRIIIVDQVHTNYHGRHMVYSVIISQLFFISKDPHYGRISADRPYGGESPGPRLWSDVL